MKEGKSVEVPFTQLPEDTLGRLIEEFVLREGTDYGHREWDVEEKISQVKRQIQSGLVKIYFDFETESCTLQRVN